MSIWFWVLLVGAYLLGSAPLSYLAARSRGVDLRKHGTQQVGGGNLWRTTSRTLGLLVGLFDFIKGALMILIAWGLGLDVDSTFCPPIRTPVTVLVLIAGR